MGGSRGITPTQHLENKWGPGGRWERGNCWTNCWERNYSTSANIQKNYNHQTGVLFNFNLEMKWRRWVEWKFPVSKSNRSGFIALWTVEAGSNELFSSFTSFIRIVVCSSTLRESECSKECLPTNGENPFFIELNEAEVLDCEWWRSFGCWTSSAFVMKMSMTWNECSCTSSCVFRFPFEGGRNKFHLLDFSGEKFSHYVSGGNLEALVNGAVGRVRIEIMLERNSLDLFTKSK